MKDNCPPERCIGWLHILMFMDDTVMLSTSRENMYRKLRILQKYCNEYGMKINNEKKNKFAL